MKIDVQEIKQDDYLLIFHDIGTLAPYDVDGYCDKLLDHFSVVFGCHVAICPVIGAETTWEMVLLRNPNRKEFLKRQEEKQKDKEVKKVA